MVWVLYGPEDGGEEQCVQGWIPFQMRWDLPENTPEGTLRLRCLTRFVDGRSTSPRKILVRAGMAVMAEAFVPQTLSVAEPKDRPEDVALLENTYPVRLMKEAGEKAFQMEEELYLPDSAPKISRILSWRVNPRITDQRILADKAVLRGNGNLHVLYRSESGQVHNWDFELPFSQYAELDSTYGNDGQADIRMEVTSLEPERMENGHIRLKCGLAAQYRISDTEHIGIVTDAYAPARETELQLQELMLTCLSEPQRDTVHGEAVISAEANICVDARLLQDFPVIHTAAGEAMTVFPGTFQLLYYGEDGKLYTGSSRWEGESPINGQKSIMTAAYPSNPEITAMPGSGNVQLRMEMQVIVQSMQEKTIPMVTKVQLGKEKNPDPARPSLVIVRCNGEDLWDLARQYGTTVESIHQANGLEGTCPQGQMLLIPVP
jgi:hypothetical protein